jgi:hypothetical protein
MFRKVNNMMQADRIYAHYLSHLEWLGNHLMAISAASALRNMHIVAKITKKWKIPKHPVELAALLQDLDRCGQGRHDVQERMRWVLDSSVGDLMKLAPISQTFEDDRYGSITIPSSIIEVYGCMPNAMSLLRNEKIPTKWLLFLDSLKKSIANYDLYVRRRLFNAYDIRILLFCGYSLAMMLHQGLVSLEYISAWRLRHKLVSK